MLSSIKDYIKKEKLISPGDKVLLTVSGGVDSIVMCALFKQAGISFGIAHCNFQLRGKESDMDELFTEDLAEQLAVPFHSISFETAVFAKKNKLSIQAAARKLRYDWFEELREHFGYTSIATAHHSDDSAETFFINLIRGTGISGLHGIRPKQGNVIRPLLFADKQKILAFAKKNKLHFREDSSNASEKYVRNKIRLKLIPLLKEMNPDVSNTLLETIEKLSMTESVYLKEIGKQKKKLVKNDKGRITISIPKLKTLDPLPAYLFEFLRSFGFNFQVVLDIIRSLESHSGKQFYSETHRLIRERNELVVESKKSEARSEKLEARSKKLEVNIGQEEINFQDLKLTFTKTLLTSDFKLPTLKNIAALDYHKLKFPLEIRRWKNGDSFQPLGMKGKKKLSDFFIDGKFSKTKKENTWLLLSEGNIIWVIGERMDDRFKISPKTKKIYFVHVD